MLTRAYYLGNRAWFRVERNSTRGCALPPPESAPVGYASERLAWPSAGGVD
jgi:hypothetical protein